ncbi:hypothetical protein [Campylobacter coli]|uniref:hypothetical protein n=1 Tax=Campylobacter coli TaxID=195 RepID=UPI001F1844A2|nr:hypothetical protein [Campylobacter coli]
MREPSRVGYKRYIQIFFNKPHFIQFKLSKYLNKQGNSMAKNKNQNENTTQTNQNSERISRAEFLRRRIEGKKRTIDLNSNAQVFVSDSIAGTEIFSDLRMLDAMDSTIRKLWGNGVDSQDAETWVKEINSIKESINELQNKGREILVKVGNVRHISNNVLRRTILREIQAQNVKAE